MKIQCDVCEKEEAAVYCTADEATLCDSCDHRVHHANKLASKHQRFALLHPSTTQFPLCDICQERRAYLFCQQDRAILCRECDFPIHSANELTQNHNRFLLTGVKLSATPAVYTSSADAATPSVTTAGGGPLVPDHTNNKKSKPSLKLNHSVSDAPAVSNPASISNKSSLSSSYTSMNNNNNDMDNFIINEEGSGLRSSSISEYLIQTLPGWHFEDLLDSSSVPFGFCKSSNDVISPFLDGDVETASFSPFSSESLGIWVPQATPPPPPPPLFCSSHMINNNNNYVFKDSNVKAAHKGGGLISDDVFTVPQICSRPAIISKRPRPSW